MQNILARCRGDPSQGRGGLWLRLVVANHAQSAGAETQECDGVKRSHQLLMLFLDTFEAEFHTLQPKRA